jgi:hypothetical protein
VPVSLVVTFWLTSPTAKPYSLWHARRLMVASLEKRLRVGIEAHFQGDGDCGLGKGLKGRIWGVVTGENQARVVLQTVA